MAARKFLPAVITLAALMAGCGSTGESRSINPFPWPKHPAAKHPAINPALPAAGSGRGGYYQDDGPEDNPPSNLLDVPDAELKVEPLSKWANRPYSVFGKRYTPILHSEPFRQRGVATWYGKKFHGQRTASGELYDMYKMTAAHPTLPIPSYARVTSLDSGKVVVVRINDRGPFHSSRVIDVSYTAALKLGLLGKGSHQVEVERLLPGDPARIATARRAAASAADALPPPPAVAALMLEDRVELASAALVPESVPAPQPAATDARTGEFYLQLGAYSRVAAAEDMAQRMRQADPEAGPIDVVRTGGLHRLYSGPFATRDAARQALRELPPELGFKPLIIKR
jgi:rare lipoprotein A